MCLEIKFRRIDYSVECDSLSNDRSVHKKKMGENCLKIIIVNIFSNPVQLGIVDGSLRKPSVIAAITALYCTHVYVHAYNISFMLYNFNRIFIIKPWQFKQYKVF